MAENMTIPQIEAEQAEEDARKARYVAYMQCVRKLEAEARAKAESRKKAERMGGAAV